MILQSMNDPEIEQQNLRLCRYNHTAGIFIAITSNTKDIAPFKKLETLDIPLVFFDTVPPEDSFNRISIADMEMGRTAAEKLLANPREAILAIMGKAHLSITIRREKGFTEYNQLHAPNVPLEIRYADHAEDARQIVKDYFLGEKRPYTAIFSMSDEIMCGVIKGLNDLNMRLPADAAMLTVSNGFYPSLFAPEISYVKTSGYDLGKLSFSRMVEIMEGKKFIRENFLPSTFYQGGTL